MCEAPAGSTCRTRGGKVAPPSRSRKAAKPGAGTPAVPSLPPPSPAAP
ncbi:hypothetical protein [Streptosporangium roseum]